MPVSELGLLAQVDSSWRWDMDIASPGLGSWEGACPLRLELWGLQLPLLPSVTIGVEAEGRFAPRQGWYLAD